MARLEFTTEVTAACTPERAFDYFADYHHVAGVLEGVSRWEPIGRKTRGVGARFNVEIVALGVPIKSVLRLNRWRRSSAIGWVSESGLIKEEGGFTFKKVSNGVHIQLSIAYVPPASFIGATIARQLEGVVRHRLEGALERIREKLEGASN